MASKLITIQLKGDPAEGEHLRLTDFIAQLEAIKGALNSVEEHITHNEKSAIYYRIVDLRHSSPATVVLEPVSLSDSQDMTALVVDSFAGAIRNITQGIAPPGFGYDLLESFKKLAAPLKRRVSELSIFIDGEEDLEVTKNIEVEIDKIVGPDELTRGSVSGILEYFNVHAGANLLRIYPIVGPKKVDCHFPQEMLNKVLGGITKYVNVEGELRYKSGEPFPYAINASDFEIFPDEDNLPTLLDLRGIARDATGNMSSEEFVASLRNG